ASDEELPIELSYKGQIIMGITIQSVFWYKEKRNQISREEIIELYTQTLEKFS
ncbi:TetR/AcrR family transcriptional regulator, partial [Enterococcus faecium]|nr:TetR/AcrR family transcriptional regulator [Enterococcus faecium]